MADEQQWPPVGAPADVPVNTLRGETVILVMDERKDHQFFKCGCNQYTLEWIGAEAECENCGAKYRREGYGGQAYFKDRPRADAGPYVCTRDQKAFVELAAKRADLDDLNWDAVGKEIARLFDEVKRPIGDPVNHPSHYQTKGGKEVIEVIEEFGLGFHLGNAIKYLARSGRKGTEQQEIEDLKKARWYVRRYFELTKEEPCRPNDMK